MRQGVNGEGAQVSRGRRQNGRRRAISGTGSRTTSHLAPRTEYQDKVSQSQCPVPGASLQFRPFRSRDARANADRDRDLEAGPPIVSGRTGRRMQHTTPGQTIPQSNFCKMSSSATSRGG